MDDGYDVSKVRSQTINCSLDFTEDIFSLEGGKIKMGEGSVRFLESSGDQFLGFFWIAKVS